MVMSHVGYNVWKCLLEARCSFSRFADVFIRNISMVVDQSSITLKLVYHINILV